MASYSKQCTFNLTSGGVFLNYTASGTIPDSIAANKQNSITAKVVAEVNNGFKIVGHLKFPNGSTQDVAIGTIPNQSGAVPKTFNLSKAFSFDSSFWNSVKNSNQASFSLSLELVMLDYADESWTLCTKTYTVSATSEIAPTFTATATSGQVIQGVTPVNVQITGESTKYGATIASREITIGSSRVSGSQLTITPTVSGTLNWTAAVKDSRGLAASKSGSVTVLAYTNPLVTSVVVERVNEDGEEDPEGTCAKVTVNFNAGVIQGSTSNGNTTCTFKYRKRGDSQLSTPKNVQSGVPVVIADFEFDTNYEYEFVATASDNYKSSVMTGILAKAFMTMDFKAGGKGIAFGAPATEDGFHCAMPATFTPPIPNSSLDAAPKSHEHTAGDITSGTLPVARGGTGRAALVGSASLLRDLFDTSLTGAGYIPVFTESWADGGYMTPQNLRNKMGLGNTTGALPVANGGTGANNAAGARTNLGISNAVTAEGNSGIWHYRKYSNGYAEAWGSVTFTPSGMTNDNWRWLSTSHASTQSLPFTFKKVMTADVSYNNPAIFSVIGVASASGAYTSINATKIQYWCISAVAVATSADAYIYVCGTY